MKNFFPVLVLLAGLGSSVSVAQGNWKVDPFQLYLASLKASPPEPSLLRFADECGVNVRTIVPRYAQSPSENWVLVKDLSKALEDQETDFYATVAVWHAGDGILLEQWGMELDTGNYFRRLSCFQAQRIRFLEEVDWSIPPVEDEGQRAAYPAWGFEQHRKVGKNGKLMIVFSSFVDALDQPAKTPKLDAESSKSLKNLQAAGIVTSWSDLKLPQSLLR